MTDPVPDGATDRTAAPAPAPARAAHSHRFLIVTLFVLATVVGFAAVHAVWLNRQALNTDNWTRTSSQLLENKQIQTAVAAYSVDQLFRSGVPQAELKAALPTNLQALAGPVSSGLEQLAGKLAPRLLAAPPVQAAWRAANRAAHATLLKILQGGGSLASTNGGVVTLNLHAIISQLASSLGVQAQVAAAQAKLSANRGTVAAGASTLGIALPPSSGQIVIMRSNQLGTVQDIAEAVKGAALVLPLLAFALFILAVWLSQGRRRQALRRVGWCFVAIGLLVLLDRRLAGNGIVDALVKDPANRPAGHQVWAISTTLLYDIAVAVIVYGLLFVAAAWLSGHTRPATALRRALAPRLREQPVSAYAVAYFVLLLTIIWGPTPATRQVPYIIGFIVLLGLGVRAYRRQAIAEFPDAVPGDVTRAIRASVTSSRAVPDVAVVGAGARRVGELERLATLHDGGSLTDAEFAAAKAALSNGG